MRPSTSVLKLQADPSAGTNAPFVPNGTIELADVWRGLRDGRLNFESASNTADARLISLWATAPSRVRAVGAIKQLEDLLMLGQKASALALGISPSTVAAQAVRALRQTGIPGTATRMPLILALALCAHHSGVKITAETQTAGDSLRVQLLRATTDFWRERPGLEALLTSSEHSVMELVLDGLSHREIAAKRSISARTVANQIASAFRRLGVSSRLDLIRRIAETNGGSFFWRPDEVLREFANLHRKTSELETQIKELRAIISTRGAG
jgi:DNA-binding CsgD family transcriptional regulator